MTYNSEEALDDAKAVFLYKMHSTLNIIDGDFSELVNLPFNVQGARRLRNLIFR